MLLPGLRTLRSDYFVYLNIIVESFAQEQECSYSKLTILQIYGFN